MTTYVDDMKATFGPGYVMSHMIADTEAELHEMADKIGVARRWYQGDHYDVTQSKKALAIQFGAKQITWRECGLMMLLRRRQDPNAPLLTPEEGLAWLKRRRT